MEIKTDLNLAARMFMITRDSDETSHLIFIVIGSNVRRNARSLRGRSFCFTESHHAALSDSSNRGRSSSVHYACDLPIVPGITEYATRLTRNVSPRPARRDTIGVSYLTIFTVSLCSHDL